jgi:exoribonuclease II
MEERREYRWMLGDDKQIAEIDSFEKLASQHLVEECMIAANKCAAQFLRDAKRPVPLSCIGVFAPIVRKPKPFSRSTAPS